MKVVRVDILVMFLILEEMLLAVHCRVWCWKQQISRSKKHRVPKKMNSKKYTPKLKCWIFLNRENSKNCKRKATSYIQGNFHKTISWPFSRNFAGQKGVAWYIQSDERKKIYNQEYSTWQTNHSDVKDR